MMFCQQIQSQQKLILSYMIIKSSIGASRRPQSTKRITENIKQKKVRLSKYDVDDHFNLDSNKISQTQLNSTSVIQSKINKNISQNMINIEQHDAKGFRILIHLFATNINTYYGKHHKNVLGQLEQLYKISLSNQQKTLLQYKKLKKVFDKNIDKFMKEMVARNANTIKNYQNYQKTYEKKFIDKQTILISEQILNTENVIIKNKQISQKQKKRPMSSGYDLKTRSDRYGNRKSQENILKNKQIRMAFSSQKNKQHFLISPHCEQVFIAENIRNLRNNHNYHHHMQLLNKTTRYPQKKSLLQKKNHYQNIETFISTLNTDYCKEQIIKNQSSCEIQHHKRRYSLGRANNNKYQTSSKNYNPQLICKQQGKKNIQEYQKLRLQQKLLTISVGVCPSVIQSQSQGYKPKSKCRNNIILNNDTKKTQQSKTSLTRLNSSPIKTKTGFFHNRNHHQLLKYKTLRQNK